MSRERFFLDTAYVLALLNKKDTFHNLATGLLPRVRTAAEVCTTEAVLIEIGNALGSANRASAAQFIHQCYATSNIRVENVSTPLMLQALDLYRSRQDKHWGMTDCVSFVVMAQSRITVALTADHHFEQAGFSALMLKPD